MCSVRLGAFLHRYPAKLFKKAGFGPAAGLLLFSHAAFSYALMVLLKF